MKNLLFATLFYLINTSYSLHVGGNAITKDYREMDNEIHLPSPNFELKDRFLNTMTEFKDLTINNIEKYETNKTVFKSEIEDHYKINYRNFRNMFDMYLNREVVDYYSLKQALIIFLQEYKVRYLHIFREYANSHHTPLYKIHIDHHIDLLNSIIYELSLAKLEIKVDDKLNLLEKRIMQVENELDDHFSFMKLELTVFKEYLKYMDPAYEDNMLSVNSELEHHAQ